MPQWLALLLIGLTAAYVLGRMWLTRREKDFWVKDMQRCSGVPHVREVGGGWSECTCTNCYKVFLWYDEDECICTRCGVHYWKQEDQFKPPEDWKPC